MKTQVLHQVPREEHILVVDDSPDNLFLIQSILEEEGYQITLAKNGRDALEVVEKHQPSLVLLDVMMPGMDGFEVTQRIRGNPHLPFIPILLITAYDQPSVVKGLDGGADDFIRKPVEVDELLARVRCLLRLKHSVDERDHIAREREDFVSRLTHDLRTPLVAADRMLELMQEGALGELESPMMEALATMARSNHNLLEMVNTLLEVYRYEAGAKHLHFSGVELNGLVTEVIEELQPLTTSKGLSLNLHYGEELNNGGSVYTRVLGDRLELRRVLTNLIGNALKFTSKGKVDVTLKLDTGNLNGNTTSLVVEIEDTGPGISSEEQKNLFERFRRGSHSSSGSGLGLHLSRRILETHQGSIEVKSEVGKGSLFTVRLPSYQD